MTGDSLASLVSWIPTLIVLLIVAINIVIGLWRGFRKSTILLIHYIISTAIGIIVFFTATSITYSDKLGSILSSLGPNYENAKTIPDVVRIFLEMTLPNYAGITNNAYLQQFIYAIAGLGVNLILTLICLLIIPILLRLVLYVLYLLLYSESKFKKKFDDDGEYKPRRLLGVAVGAFRGLVASLLIVSFITSFYFILSGGVRQNDKPDKVELFENLSSSIGVDVNALYQGLKTSRTTGVGKILDLIQIKGTPIDLYYADLFTTSSFTSLKVEDELTGISQYLSSDEVLQGEIAKLSLRAEGALLFNLLGDILETNAIKIVDGEVKVDRTILDSDIEVMVDEYINGSMVFSDLTPLLIIGVAEAINAGELVVEDSIKDLFTDEVIAEIKTIDFAEDISSILKIAITAAELIPVTEGTEEFDFAAFEDLNTFLQFDVDKVKNIFDGLSKVQTLTKVVFPVGVGIYVNNMESTITAQGIDPSELNFSETDWSSEVKNLGNVYEKLAALELDVNKILDQTVNEETGLSNGIQYIVDLCNDETLVDGIEKSDIFKEKLTDFVDTTFASDLLSQVGLVFVKAKIVETNFMGDDGKPSALNDSLDMVKENLKSYKKEHFRLDLHELASSCLDVTSLIPVFMGKDSDLFGKLYEIKTEDARTALLGVEDSEGNRTGGLYDLRLLNGDLDGDGKTDEGCKFATDSFIENALRVYAQDIISPSIVDSVTTVDDPTNENYDFEAWPNELNALLTAIDELKSIDRGTLEGVNINSSDLTEILPDTLTNEDVDILSGAASKSILLSGVIVDKLVSNLKNDATMGSAVSDPNIVWMDEFVIDENGEYEVVKRGEFNSVLKSFIVFTSDEKEIKLDDTNSLINGLGQLIKPATEESLSENVLDGLDYEEVNYFAKSQVIMTVLSSKISEVGNGTSGFSIVVPEKLNTSSNTSAWKDWSYDNTINYDHKRGEFAKLVLVLYNAREYSVSNSEGVENPGLNQDNLLDSVINMDKDASVVDSLVLYATMSNELMNQGTGEASIIKVRDCAKVNKPENNNGIKIVRDEIDKALDVIRNLDINLTTTGISSVGISTFLNAIKDPENGEAVRKGICVSNIFNISVISKIAENEAISVPAKYRYDSNADADVNLEDSDWYPVTDSTWRNSELNRLLLSVCELNIGDNNGDGSIDMPSTNELLRDLNKDATNRPGSKLDVVYESDILCKTINDKIEAQKTNGIVIRDEAYEWDGDVKVRLCVDEIALLSSFIVEADIDIEKGDINAEHVFNKLLNDDPTDDTFRKHICTSNILNITTIDKLAGDKAIDDHYMLAFPASYLNLDGTVNKLKEEWYPVDGWENDEWADCELNRLLIGITDLEISAKENDINFPINEKIDTLLLQSKVEPIDTNNNEINTKLDVIYHSDIMAMTISRRLNQTGSSSIKMPDVDHDGNVIYDAIEGRIALSDKVIREHEVESLLTGVVKVLGVNFHNDDPNKAFEYGDILSGESISTLNENYTEEQTRLDAMLNSSILHYIISDNLISQKQSMNENSYSIVTKDYYSVNNLDESDIQVINENMYIDRVQINSAIKVLESLGINSIADASGINVSYLGKYFGSESSDRMNLISKVVDSTIMCKIFSQILISNNILAGIDFIYKTDYLEHLTKVSQPIGDEKVDVLAQQDLRTILETYAVEFDKFKVN